MSLWFSGPRGDVEQRWIVYALLRDNVQHHLEHGVAGAEFREIHRAAQALGGGRVILDAVRLHAELERAQAGLANRCIEELAISARTRAVLDGTWPPPDSDSGVMVGPDPGAIPGLPLRIRRLDQAFGNLVRGLLEITAAAREGDCVEVTDV